MLLFLSRDHETLSKAQSRKSSKGSVKGVLNDSSFLLKEIKKIDMRKHK
jgi:hypothetical protein